MKNYTGSDLGQDFRTFYAKEKKRITSQLTAMNCKDIQMSRQFYYYSGFFTTAEGQPYYFSISDVRFFPQASMLYRKVRDYKDYTGGANCFLAGHNMHEMWLVD